MTIWRVRAGGLTSFGPLRRRREIAEQERRERERIRLLREREEREHLLRERQRLEIERQKLERERMERERLERERIRIEQVNSPPTAIRQFGNYPLFTAGYSPESPARFEPP